MRNTFYYSYTILQDLLLVQGCMLLTETAIWDQKHTSRSLSLGIWTNDESTDMPTVDLSQSTPFLRSTVSHSLILQPCLCVWAETDTK